jgi:hypothetical protein
VYGVCSSLRLRTGGRGTDASPQGHGISTIRCGRVLMSSIAESPENLPKPGPIYSRARTSYILQRTGRYAFDGDIGPTLAMDNKWKQTMDCCCAAVLVHPTHRRTLYISQNSSAALPKNLKKGIGQRKAETCRPRPIRLPAFETFQISRNAVSFSYPAAFPYYPPPTPKCILAPHH